MDIKELTAQFQTYEELQLFTASQFKQILTLSKKIKELEDKNAELAKKAKEVNALATVAPTLPVASDGAKAVMVEGDAKIIAQIQLRILKEASFERELSMEEAKKVEIYNKIANVVEEKPKTFKVDAKTIKTDDLLSLIESDAK